MSTDFETAQANIQKLADWARQNEKDGRRNEADTRLHLIDQLIFDCLGWDREDCSAEERFQGRYTDYSLGQPARQMIIEAKKEGIHFELPAGFQKRVCKLTTVLGSNSQVEEAIRQVVGYCQERGIAIGAVCNGHQIIGFLASRHDAVPPLEGLALVFTSIEQMRANFGDLWRNLSKPGLA